jgi:hypothetical protein
MNWAKLRSSLVADRFGMNFGAILFGIAIIGAVIGEIPSKVWIWPVVVAIAGSLLTTVSTWMSSFLASDTVAESAAPRPVIQNDPNEVMQQLVVAVKDNLPAEFLAAVESKIIEKYPAHQQLKLVSATFKRLQQETTAVERRARLNLIMGTMFSITGLIALLAFFLLLGTPDAESWDKTAIRYLPKLSFVLILEIFAYFFLGLYRHGVYEIKYYQNELTNVEIWSAAFVNSILNADKTAIKEMGRKLLTIERNFVLKKGESTVIGRQAADDNKGVQADLGILSDLLRKAKKMGKATSP